MSPHVLGRMLQRRPAVAVAGALVTVVGVGWVDRVTGDRISFSLFYLIPVAAAAWVAGSRIGVLVAEAPWQAAMLSLELRAPEAGAAARVRERPPALSPAAGAVTLSGILLFEPADSLPGGLAVALTRPHIGGITRGERIGLYWEAYGLAPGEDVATAVTVTPERNSWLRRVAATLRLAPRKGSVRVEWREGARLEQGRAPRALVLDLAGLAAGRYRIDIAVSAAGRAEATSSRRVDVIER